MKKEFWIIIILAIIIVALVGVLVWFPAKKQATPATVRNQDITVSVKSGQTISSPLKITGTVYDNGWAGFEGQVGNVKLVDSNGTEIVAEPLIATTEWTKLPTNFEANLQFDAAPGSAQLIFHNENPSGIPEKDKTFILPVKIIASENPLVGVATIKIYFANSRLNGQGAEYDCSKVFAVEREVATPAVATAAINELLKGPTAAEKSQGYNTEIPNGSKLNSISIVNGTALADFNETTESGGGSCSMAGRTWQIVQTLKQFSTIKLVRLSIDGRTEDIFQP